MFGIMSLAAFAQSVAAAPAPQVNGIGLRAGTTCYAIERGGTVIGATRQSIEPTRLGGVRAWRIVIHQRLAGGRFDMRDTFLVRRKDLRPLRFDSRRESSAGRRDWREVHVQYGTRKISGTLLDASGTKRISVPLKGPVWDGNLWGLTFAALPLKEGRRFQLPFWQHDKGFGSFLVNVVGSEVVETSDGKTEAWVVEAGDNPARLARYLIAKRSRMELGYSGQGMVQRIGGDCRGMR